MSGRVLEAHIVTETLRYKAESLHDFIPLHYFFFFSSRRRHTRFDCDWSSDVCSSDLARFAPPPGRKGTLCLFHGRAEFIEKYFEVVEDARARGFAVATFDWSGQGLSQQIGRASCRERV